ncbi:MAG: SDR family oxidoreductase [Leptospiraceae bacterium]|nr:SDR family oxidoreductase [Leptospiraceae bacterium]
METQLRGKRALIAAGSKGLGFGIASNLAREGAHVSICSRDVANAAAAADHIQSETGQDCHYFAADVSRNVDLDAWVMAAAEALGGIDLVVANAGGPPAGNFQDFQDEHWHSAFQLTLMSVVRLVRYTLPYLKQSEAPSILAITSASIKEPIDNLLLSNVFRSGVAALIKSLSQELAPYGIRVNNLAPGRIDTDRVRSLDEAQAKKNNRDYGEQRRISEATIPLGRYGQIEEFGRAGAFLLSPAAAYLTGQTLFVDGGSVKSY